MLCAYGDATLMAYLGMSTISVFLGYVLQLDPATGHRIEKLQISVHL
jgi:hypothetical protein